MQKIAINQVDKQLEDRMRILANFLIDRFLEDKKNNNLQKIKYSTTIKNRLTNQ